MKGYKRNAKGKKMGRKEAMSQNENGGQRSRDERKTGRKKYI